MVVLLRKLWRENHVIGNQCSRSSGNIIWKKNPTAWTLLNTIKFHFTLPDRSFTSVCEWNHLKPLFLVVLSVDDYTGSKVQPVLDSIQLHEFQGSTESKQSQLANCQCYRTWKQCLAHTGFYQQGDPGTPHQNLSNFWTFNFKGSNTWASEVKKNYFLKFQLW